MKPALVEVVVLNAVAATHGDALFAYGKLQLGLLQKNKIPFRDLDAIDIPLYKAYAAGTPKQMTNTITNAADGKTLTMTINKSYYDQNSAVLPSKGIKNLPESYTILTGTGATVTTIAAAFAAAITREIANGASSMVTATNVAGVLTLVAEDATFDFELQAGPATGITQTFAVTVSLVYPSGTYAEVLAAYTSAGGPTAPVSTKTYNRYSYFFWRPYQGGNEININGTSMQLVEVRCYYDSADADAGDYKTYIDAVNAGTDTAANYLGSL